MNVQRKYSQPPQLTSTPRPSRKTAASFLETFDEVSPIFPVPGRKTKSLIPVARKSSQPTKSSVVRNFAQTNNIDIQRSTELPKVCILKSTEETNNPVAWLIPPEVKTSTLTRKSSNVENLAKSNVVIETVEEPSDVIEANPTQSLKPAAKKSARARSTLKAIAEEEFMNMSDEDKIKMHNMNNISVTCVNSEDIENRPTDEQVPKETVRKTRKNLATTTAAAAAEKERSLKRNVKNCKDDVPVSVIGDVKKSEPENIMNDTSTRRAPKRKCAVKNVSSGTTGAKELQNGPETISKTVSKSSIQSTGNKKRKTQAKSSKVHCDNKEKTEPMNAEDKYVIPKAEPLKKTVVKKRVQKTKTDKSKSEEKLIETNEVICGVQKTKGKMLPNDSAPNQSKTTVKRRPQVSTADLDQSVKKQKWTKKTHPSTEVPANLPVETKPEKVENPKEKRENERSCKFTVLHEKGAFPLADENRPPSLPLPLPLHESEHSFHVKSCFGLERAKAVQYVPGVDMYTLLHINNYVMTGKMLVKPRATINTSSTNTAYFVTQGDATVTIMSTKKVIKSEDERNTFFIPKGADFSIVNESRDVLQLLFTKFKD